MIVQNETIFDKIKGRHAKELSQNLHDFFYLGTNKHENPLTDSAIVETI